MTDQDPEIFEDSEVGEQPDKPDMVLVGTEDAARVEGIASRTVRKRIGTGELTATKINGAWFVELPREKVEAAGIAIPDLDGEISEHDNLPIVGASRAARSGAGTVAVPEPVDMGPMANLIADLNRQVAELSATAGMLQERNRTLEEQRKTATLALESGQDDHQKKIDELQAQIDQARKDGRTEADAEWRNKSWWQRLKGE